MQMTVCRVSYHDMEARLEEDTMGESTNPKYVKDYLVLYK